MCLLLSCGSNASGQLNAGILNCFIVKRSLIIFPGSALMTTNLLRTQTPIEPYQISCGSTLSAALSRDGDAYLWGSGLPGLSLRIPTRINVKIYGMQL